MNRKAMQFKKNTVTVTADGDVFAANSELAAVVEAGLYYSPQMDRFLARSVPGITIKYI